jgi:uncharacterized protein YaiE (UPF0345 family)
MPTFDNVSLDTTANIYFDGKCISRRFFRADDTKKSAGVIFPSTLPFGRAAPEVMDIEAGSCAVTLNAETTAHAAGGPSPSRATHPST